jgi:hypothetical protein
VDVGGSHKRLFGVVYVTCGDFHYGSKKVTASVHQIYDESQRMLDTDRKGLPGSVPEKGETVGPVSTCGRELLRG